MIRTPAAAILASAAALSLAACAAQKPVQDDYVTRAPAVSVVGQAKTCIQTGSILRTRVYDDRTIDFEMVGGKTYRQTLAYDCPNLGFSEAFSYQTTASQLCSNDLIHVIDTMGANGPGCGLRPFVPVERIK